MGTTKLTCRDLMIGDWVECNGKFIQVENVHKDMINYTPDIPYVQEEYFIEGKDITPIPLTAEILEKNGFKYNDIPIVLGWEQYGLTLYKGGNGFLVNCGQNVALILNYVHELQHVLHLCGINDKEIVL